jgi:hypothetical protein
MSRLPQNLLGITLLAEDDESAVTLVLYRWDQYDHLGWDKPFIVTLTFPDTSIVEIEVPISARLDDGHSLKVPTPGGTLLREREQQKSRVIPRIVFNLSAPLEKQLSQSVRRLLKNVRRMTDLVQCTALYLVIEDEAGTKEVEESGIPGFPEAYAALRSGSYKADILRYYLLYRYGGVYLDDKTFLRHSLDSTAFDYIFSGAGTDEQPCEMFIGVAGTTEIAFMSARPGSPIMLKALETAIKNVQERYYSNHRLGITGNIMFQRTLFAGGEGPYPTEESSVLRERWKKYWGERSALLPLTPSDERILYDNDILWQRQAIPRADWPKPANYYANLWAQNMVYTDGNPPPILVPPMNPERKREVIAYTAVVIAIICVGFLISQYPPIQWI